jgi:hypothetical protein
VADHSAGTFLLLGTISCFKVIAIFGAYAAHTNREAAGRLSITNFASRTSRYPQFPSVYCEISRKLSTLYVTPADALLIQQLS